MFTFCNFGQKMDEWKCNLTVIQKTPQGEIDIRKVNDKSQKYMCIYDLASIEMIC
jgi:hypothetical protein